MGNISYLIAVENKQDLTAKKIATMLAERFPRFSVELLDVGQIVIQHTDKLICEMWIEDECALLKDEPIEEIKTNGKCIGVSYGTMNPYSFTDAIRSCMIKYLITHFKGYWLDEGIHPEYMRYDDKCLNKYRI